MTSTESKLSEVVNRGTYGRYGEFIPLQFSECFVSMDKPELVLKYSTHHPQGEHLSITRERTYPLVLDAWNYFRSELVSLEQELENYLEENKDNIELSAEDLWDETDPEDRKENATLEDFVNQERELFEDEYVTSNGWSGMELYEWGKHSELDSLEAVASLVFLAGNVNYDGLEPADEFLIKPDGELETGIN